MNVPTSDRRHSRVVTVTVVTVSNLFLKVHDHDVIVTGSWSREVTGVDILPYSFCINCIRFPKIQAVWYS